MDFAVSTSERFIHFPLIHKLFELMQTRKRIHTHTRKSKLKITFLINKISKTVCEPSYKKTVIHNNKTAHSNQKNIEIDKSESKIKSIQHTSATNKDHTEI